MIFTHGYEKIYYSYFVYEHNITLCLIHVSVTFQRAKRHLKIQRTAINMCTLKKSCHLHCKISLQWDSVIMCECVCVWYCVSVYMTLSLLKHFKAKQKYPGFDSQKSVNKTSSGDIGLNIRKHTIPKVGQDQVSGGVSVLCWYVVNYF